MNSPNIKRQMQTVWVRNNVAFLVRYWWTAKGCAKSGHGNTRIVRRVQRQRPGLWIRHCGLSGHLEHHNYAGVLLAFASFEEFFTVLCADLGALRGVSVELSDLKNRGVPRFRKYIHKVCRLAPAEIEVDWTFLEQFSIVRNCIVHANGNKGRLVDSRSLNKIMAAHPTELSYRHDMKLVISDDFVARCFRAAERASLAVIGYMSAQSNKPLQPPSSGKSGVD